MPLIQMDGITKTYVSGGMETQVLKGITLHVEEGEYMSLIGPSGAGKSTLMAIMGCLGRPTEGSYFLDGEDVAGMGDQELSRVRNAKIGFVFQAFHLLPGVTAFDNVKLPLQYGDSIPPDADDRVREALGKVGLGHRLHHTPGKLSGGEQQRVTIARALINNPRIILADEPTGNLDSRNGAEIMSVFDSLNSEGRTIILITHDPHIAQHGRRTVSIMDGRIIEDRRHESIQKSASGVGRPAAE